MPAVEWKRLVKSPSDLAAKLLQQWNNADLRVARLLDAESWPLRLPIARPTAREVIEHPRLVREHVARWRAVRVGTVQWRDEKYRKVAQAIAVPVEWRLRTPSQWIDAADDADVRHEFRRLEHLAEHTDAAFHPLLVRHRVLWRERADEEVLQAVRLALALTPGCALGRPLRSLAREGIDSKFLERHRNLVVALLDVRFDGQASELGLETLLDAKDEGAHWLLLVPLDAALLPFEQQRVRSDELATVELPGSHLLVVENEQCLHSLPRLRDTIAILGAGLNLGWLAGDSWRRKRIGYWGDIDSWGLAMLARARGSQPQVEALLMDRQTFDRFAETCAVPEPIRAATDPPAQLSDAEARLYRHLQGLAKARIEQEFLSPDHVTAALEHWRRSTT